MNSFQKKAIDKLGSLSQKINVPFKVVEEKSGDFIKGQISDFDIWLYDEGDADFISTNYDHRFEKYDYDNEDLLLTKMIACLEDGLLNKEKYAKSPQKSSPALFNNLFYKIKKLFS